VSDVTLKKIKDIALVWKFVGVVSTICS